MFLLRNLSWIAVVAAFAVSLLLLMVSSGSIAHCLPTPSSYLTPSNLWFFSIGIELSHNPSVYCSSQRLVLLTYFISFGFLVLNAVLTVIYRKRFGKKATGGMSTYVS